MACSVLLYARFADSQKSRFQASKRSNMRSAILEGGRTADIHELCLKQQNVQIRTVSNCKGVYSLIVRNGIFRFLNVQVIAVKLQERRFADFHE